MSCVYNFLCVLVSVVMLSGCISSKDAASNNSAKSPINAKLQFEMTKIGSLKSPVGSSAYPARPENARCTKSIPATCHFELVCSTETRADKRCKYLQANKNDLFKPLAQDAVCAQIYGGPEKVLITGAMGSDKINVQLSRENGCEIARWVAHEKLWN